MKRLVQYWMLDNPGHKWQLVATNEGILVLLPSGELAPTGWRDEADVLARFEHIYTPLMGYRWACRRRRA